MITMHGFDLLLMQGQHTDKGRKTLGCTQKNEPERCQRSLGVGTSGSLGQELWVDAEDMYVPSIW